MMLLISRRHPRHEVTRPERMSILMCFIMVAMLCDIMFYRPDDYGEIPVAAGP
jgi:hypothetical protein